jgi:hypothetical protein
LKLLVKVCQFEDVDAGTKELLVVLEKGKKQIDEELVGFTHIQEARNFVVGDIWRLTNSWG